MSQSAVQIESVESIKKGFIELNRLPEKEVSLAAIEIDQARVLQIKRWLADRVKEYGVETDVASGLHSLNLDVIRPAYKAVPAVLDAQKPIVLSNVIASHACAVQAYDYGVIGLKAVPEYLSTNLKGFWLQLFDGLDVPQRDLLVRRYGLNLDEAEQRQMALEFYLADLSVLNVQLSFLQRRESWQRQVVRKMYPSLPWSSQDLHYVLHQARRQLRKQAAKR